MEPKEDQNKSNNKKQSSESKSESESKKESSSENSDNDKDNKQSDKDDKKSGNEEEGPSKDAPNPGWVIDEDQNKSEEESKEDEVDIEACCQAEEVLMNYAIEEEINEEAGNTLREADNGSEELDKKLDGKETKVNQEGENTPEKVGSKESDEISVVVDKEEEQTEENGSQDNFSAALSPSSSKLNIFPYSTVAPQGTDESGETDANKPLMGTADFSSQQVITDVSVLPNEANTSVVCTLGLASTEGRYFDIAGIGNEKSKNGQSLQVCNLSADQVQRFSVKKLDDGSYNIGVEGLDDKVLDLRNGGNDGETAVQSYASNGSTAQKWAIEEKGNGLCRIKSVASGGYLTVKNVEGGLPQIRADGTAGNAQEFKLNIIKK